MSTGTAIEWTEATWNPVTGCDRVSPGCDNCYAATLAKRLKAMGNPRYQKDGTRSTSGPGFGLTLHPDQVDLPLRWKKPHVVFVNSMSDLFHPDVPTDFIVEVFATMAIAHQHTFQVLTKRPRRMRDLLSDGDRFAELMDEAIARRIDHGEDLLWDYPLKNVWLGTSVEDQKWADQRIPLLIETPAAVRFLSCEPLLESIDLSRHLAQLLSRKGAVPIECEHGYDSCPMCDANQIHWVIVGGESGPGYRPFDLKWARSLRDQCVSAGVPFFFKQVGGRTPKAGGRDLDGRTWDEMPATPAEIVRAS